MVNCKNHCYVCSRLFLLIFTALICLISLNAASVTAPQFIDEYEGFPRVFVLTDMGNEPDDQMSMVRLLTYSNEMDLEGLIATTSTWQRAKRETETIRGIIASYGQVRSNLQLHANDWPTAKYLDSLVSVGQSGYGMADVGVGKSSPGSEALIKAVDKADERPLWVTVWGGANTLAQALFDVRATRTLRELNVFEDKLRVYSISDQDDAGPWVRENFPNVFYIVKPSSPDGGEYASATWTGIAGDEYYQNGQGADFSQVTNQWLEQNVRQKGPLGKHYLNYAFIMEGDTPSFLGLTNNGLNSFRNPSWGGWGGRYIFRQPYGEKHAIWSQGGDWAPRVTSADSVIGQDGQTYVSDQATIWRWRNQFQNDFAARMDWTIKPYEQANHHPQAVVNGQKGKHVIHLQAKSGQTLTLVGGESSDPDGNKLHYRWLHYREAGFTETNSRVGLAELDISSASSSKTSVKIHKACRSGWLPLEKDGCLNGGVAHIIFAVSDDGAPSLTSYRRIIITVDD